MDRRLRPAQRRFLKNMNAMGAYTGGATALSFVAPVPLGVTLQIWQAASTPAGPSVSSRMRRVRARAPHQHSHACATSLNESCNNACETPGIPNADPPAVPLPVAQEQSPQPPDSSRPGRVTSYCVASQYRMAALYRRLLRNGNKGMGGKDAGDSRSYEGLLNSDASVSAVGSNVLHVDIAQGREVFCFGFGCIVTWGSERKEDDAILRLFERDAVDVRPAPLVESLDWNVGTAQLIVGDNITLRASDDPHVMTMQKLSISFALSQSVRLATFEISIRRTIERTRVLPEEMARRGKISAGRGEIAAALGSLFLHRYAFNLNSEVVVTPQFFWDNEEYLPAYRRMERYMELGERASRHSAQLNALQNLLELLATSENNRHASELEMAILVLIAVELALTLTAMAREGLTVLLSSILPILFASTLFCIVYIVYRRSSYRKQGKKQISVLVP